MHWKTCCYRTWRLPDFMTCSPIFCEGRKTPNSSRRSRQRLSFPLTSLPIGSKGRWLVLELLSSYYACCLVCSGRGIQPKNNPPKQPRSSERRQTYDAWKTTTTHTLFILHMICLPVQQYNNMAVYKYNVHIYMILRGNNQSRFFPGQSCNRTHPIDFNSD